MPEREQKSRPDPSRPNRTTKIAISLHPQLSRAGPGGQTPGTLVARQICRLIAEHGYAHPRQMRFGREKEPPKGSLARVAAPAPEEFRQPGLFVI